MGLHSKYKVFVASFSFLCITHLLRQAAWWTFLDVLPTHTKGSPTWDPSADSYRSNLHRKLMQIRGNTGQLRLYPSPEWNMQQPSLSMLRFSPLFLGTSFFQNLLFWPTNISFLLRTEKKQNKPFRPNLLNVLLTSRNAIFSFSNLFSSLIPSLLSSTVFIKFLWLVPCPRRAAESKPGAIACSLLLREPEKSSSEPSTSHSVGPPVRRIPTTLPRHN